jgi:hypothetical protein
MSHLVVTDLNRVEELCAHRMGQVTGGAMNCGQAIAVSGFYIALSGVFDSMGMSSDAAAAAGKAQGVLMGSCPA